MKKKFLILAGLFTIFQFGFSYDYGLGYEMKNKKLYYYGRLIKETDIKTFKILNEYHSKDKNNVYFEENKIKGADVETFEGLNDEFSKDKNTAYYRNEKIIDSDTETFIVYGEHLAKDKNNYYLGTLTLFILALINEDIEGNTLKIVDGIYVNGKESDDIYFISESKKFAYRMIGANLKTFKSYKKLQKRDGVIFDSEDKNNYYKSGEVVKKK